MTLLEFLQFVLPENGCYAKMTLEPGGSPKQVLFDTADELAASIERNKAQANKNIYYAVASFKNKSSRKQANVLSVKALFLDVDCGPEKPFADKREGAKALGKFVLDANMPKPTVVDSGNGLHVYWVLTEEIDAKKWTSLANALKRLTQQHKFPVDIAVISDSARVLRPIDTINLKGGHPVKLLMQGPTIDPAFFEKKFATAVTPAPTIEGMAIPAHVLNRTAKVTTLQVAPDYPPAHPDLVAEKCHQIAWGVANQAKVTEPFWYAMLGVAAHCLDADATAVAWSSGHPEYDQITTLAKMARWRASTTGPATCAKFKELRPKGCDKCRFKDRVSTPAQIGVCAEPTDISKDAPDGVAFEVPMPKWFKRVLSNAKIKFVKIIEKTDVDICKFDIYPVSYGRDEALGYEVVRYKWKRPHVGWSDLVLRQALLNHSSLREFGTALADQGIVLESHGLLELFQEMLRAYMDELRQLRSLTNLYHSMGWKERFTQFLIGSTMYTRMTDGTIVESSMAMSGTVQTSAQEMYHTSGTLQRAIDATAVLERFKLYAHMFAFGVSLSNPLYAFTGIDGVIVHLHGETGAGKTLAQYWQQSAWGNPKVLHFSAQFTMNALFSRLGLHCHLPMTIDETTRMTSAHMNELTLMVSQGREKYRMTKNAEDRTPKTWAGAITTSGNRPVSVMLSSIGAEHEAQLMRALDVPVAKHKIFEKGSGAGELIYRELTANYGWIGPIVLKHWMAMGETAIREMIDKHKVKFMKKYGAEFAGQERFWQTAIVLADLALETAAKLGLIKFNHEGAIMYVLNQLKGLRKNVDEAQLDEFDYVNMYLNEHMRDTVTVMHTGSDNGVYDPNNLPRDTIRIRYDIYRKTRDALFDRGTAIIDKKHMRTWMVEQSGDMKAVTEKLVAEGILLPLPNNKAVLGKGIRIRTPQVLAVKINLAHPRLRSILDSIEDNTLENALQNQLTLVKQ